MLNRTMHKEKCVFGMLQMKLNRSLLTGVHAYNHIQMQDFA